MFPVHIYILVNFKSSINCNLHYYCFSSRIVLFNIDDIIFAYLFFNGIQILRRNVFSFCLYDFGDNDSSI